MLSYDVLLFCACDSDEPVPFQFRDGPCWFHLSLSKVENDAVRSDTRGDLLANIFSQKYISYGNVPRVDVYEKDGDDHFEHSAMIVVTSYPPPSASLDELMKNITTEPVGDICICDPGIAFKQGPQPSISHFN